MKKRIGFLLVLTILLTFFSGCSNEQKKQEGYAVYYLSKDGMSIAEEFTELSSISEDGMIKELLEKLKTEPESVEYHKTIAEGIEVTNFYMEEENLSLFFNEEYSRMDSMTEVLCRAAIVYTLLQVPGITTISFYVNGEPLTDGSGNLVGAMDKDSFVQNPGEQINSIQNAVLTLYFANLSGDRLLKETQSVHYSSNISLDKLVVERLLAGPLSTAAQGTIPTGTQILNVTTVDGVCYVNFDETFLNQNYEIAENVVVYSIVDSLLELEDVDKVQISVNGDTSRTFRDKFSLSTIYEADYDLVDGFVTDFETDTTQSEETLSTEKQ